MRASLFLYLHNPASPVHKTRRSAAHAPSNELESGDASPLRALYITSCPTGTCSSIVFLITARRSGVLRRALLVALILYGAGLGLFATALRA